MPGMQWPVKVGSRLRGEPEAAIAPTVDAYEFVVQVQGQGGSLNDMASGLIAPPLICVSVGVSRLGSRRGKREKERDKDKDRVGQEDSGTKTKWREGVKIK